jgi:DNA polymerase III alpha subunit
MLDKNYVVYHLHTELSLLDSATKFEDYIERAAQLGQSAIAFTEHG